MDCFTCGKGFTGGVREALLAFKQDFERKGIERYFYTLKEGGEVFVCRKSNFKIIFDNDIKPNFKNGATYAHISEYNPKP